MDARPRRAAPALAATLLLAASAPVDAATTTPASGWSPPAVISDGPSADESRIAVGTDGTTAVVWKQSLDPWNAPLKARISRAGRPLGPAFELSDPEGTWPSPVPWVRMGGNGSPGLGVDRDGRVIAAWGHRSAVRAIVIEPDGRARPRVTLSREHTDHPNPHVGIDAAGDATVLWAFDSSVVSVRRPAGGDFGEPQRIEHSAERVERPQYAVAANDDAVAVWTSFDEIHAALRHGDGRFRPAVRLNPDLTGVTAVGGLRVAMNRDGAALAAWVEQHHTKGYVRVAYRAPGGAFGAPQTVAEVFYTATYDVSVAVDDAGTAAVSWVGHGYEPEPVGAITARLRSADGRWSPPEPLSATVSGYEPPQLAFDRQGRLHATWRHYDDRSLLLARALAATRPAGGRFSGRVAVLSEDGQNVWPGSIATHPDGRVVAVYSRGIFPYGFHLELTSADGGWADPDGSTTPMPNAPTAATSPPGLGAPAPTKPPPTGAGPDANPGVVDSARAPTGAAPQPTPSARRSHHDARNAAVRAARAVAARLRTARVGDVRRRLTALRVPLAPRIAMTGRVLLRAGTARPRELATLAVSSSAAANARLRLDPGAQRALDRARDVRSAVEIAFTARNGEGGRPAVVRQRVALRARSAR